MPILGMVLVLDDPEPATRQAVAHALEHAPDLVLGEPAEHRWPAVLESPDPRRAESRIDDLRAIPGIAGVDVVYADFEDLIERSSSADAHEES
jgi:hypothetical protein